MFVHQSARENEFSGKGRVNQRLVLANQLEAVQRALRTAGDVRLKTYANNEIRVSFPAGATVVRRYGSEAGAEACFEAAESALVYNAKVQHGEIFGDLRPARHRPMKLTRYAAHRVREACAVVERDFGLQSYFVTLTLPGSTEDALRTAADQATGILNAFMQRIRHESAASGSETEGVHACGVWEYQKRGALHFHLLIGIKDEKLVQHLEAHHQRYWRQVLLTYSKKTGVDLFARKEGGTWRRSKSKPRTEWAKVRKSVGRYMSKYLAKSARELTQEGWYPPSSWHYVSEPVWEEVKACRRLDVVTLLSREIASEAATGLAAMAQEYGAKIYPTSNPFTQEPCGYVMFFDNDKKEECFEALLLEMRLWRDSDDAFEREYAARPPNEFWETGTGAIVNFIFQGVPLDAVALRDAGLCAPFSYKEKGGGMR